MYHRGVASLFVCLLGVIACAGNQADTPTLLVGNFATKGLLPKVLVSPGADAVVGSTSASFSWSERVPQYQVEIARDAAFSQVIVSKMTTSPNYTLASADLKPGENLASGMHYWRVRIPFVQNDLLSKTGAFYLQIIPEAGSGNFGKIYVNKNSSSLLQNGGTAAPYKSIQTAIVAANTLRNSNRDIYFQIFVAQGTYNESITQYAGISLYGGYNAALPDTNGEWTRNVALYTTSITATGMRGVTYGSDVTAAYRAATVLDGFTVTGGAGEAPYGVYLNNASPTISNNRINSGTPVFQVSAVYAMNNSAPVIQGNTITASQQNAVGIDAHNCNGITIERNTIVALGTVYSAGLVIRNSATFRVLNNVVLGGTSNSAESIGIDLTTSTGEIAGNTIYAGQGSFTYGIELNSGTNVSIRNNVIFTTTAGGTRHCIYENGTGNNPVAVQNNNLFGCPTGVYRDADNGCGGGATCSLAQMTALGANYSGNVSIDNSGSQLFVDVDGADNNLGTMTDNDWRLTSNAAICDVRGGGLDLTTLYTSDRIMTNRTATLPSACTPTNTGAAGWSMGAYESD
ncbi:MAG: hypothetical protein ACOY5B_10340 [Spirochaetota bacterium]